MADYFDVDPAAANAPNDCSCCGRDIDDCICRECSVCGAQGDPACYGRKSRGKHGLKFTQRQKYGLRLHEIDREIESLQSEASYLSEADSILNRSGYK